MIRAAILAAAVAVVAAAPVHADPSDTDQVTTAICTASRLGESPSQIVDELHQGDGRWNGLPAWNKVDETVVGGDCG